MEDMAELKIHVKNFGLVVEKNTEVIQEISITNARVAQILQQQINDTKDLKQQQSADMKEIKTEIKQLALENSKNTDSRLTAKQTWIAIILIVASVVLGGIWTLVVTKGK